MQIQINTDHNIECHEGLTTLVHNVVENALNRLSNHITRIEVHLSDENGHKRSKEDKRCMMEARLEGRKPVAVTQKSAKLDDAINGAADKLARLIENNLGKSQHQNGHHRDQRVTT